MSNFEAPVVEACALGKSEDILSCWQVDNGWGRLVLTSLRLIYLHGDFGWGGNLKKATVSMSRPLEGIPDPKVSEDALLAAGLTIHFEDGEPEAAKDEIAYARSMRLTQLGMVLPDNSAGASSSVTHKEVITREIVKIPCRYCGTLVDQTVTTCQSCGAKMR